MAIRSFFSLMRKSNGVYEKYCQKVTRDWGLNATSFQVIMFFANNPEYNTARDLCQLRGMKTGIASVAIEPLTQGGRLERKTDPKDRRIQRLYQTEKAEPLGELGRAIQERFFNQIKGGLTEEEFDTYLKLTLKLKNTIDEMDKSM